jgi:hypothetical protein
MGERLSDLRGATKRVEAALAEFDRIISASLEHLRVGAPAFKVDEGIAFTDLKELVTAAGYKADRSRTGPLITLLDMIFVAIGEQADAYSVVDYRLKLEKRGSKN